MYLLRVLQVGLNLNDLHLLDYGMVMDILTESGNDNEEYMPLATQSDFDRF